MAKQTKAAIGISQWIKAIQQVAETMQKLKDTEKTINIHASIIKPGANDSMNMFPSQLALDLT